MKDKIKVVWLCHFSNAFVHERLDLGYSWLMKAIRKLIHKPLSTEVPEFAIWITNAIREFEKIDEVELHVVSPYPHLISNTQEFVANGIYYHFFHDESDSLIDLFYRNLFHPKHKKYKRNRKLISSIIDKIQPEVVHLIGAENPYYSMGLLDVSQGIVTIAQLQTLMNDPGFKENYPIDSLTFQYRAEVERKVIEKADFIGAPVQKYRNVILNTIKPNAVFLMTGLALKEPNYIESCEKQYDFVYFAANINKAADLAIEAYAIACKQKSSITLDIIGEFSDEYRKNLEKILSKYGVNGSITFEGKLPTHDDVIKQIRKSRFALLPLKVDLVSGTIREAMTNGLPVVTTDTGELGTQKLNLKCKNVLISPIGDHAALASNMLLLLENNELAEELRQNAFKTRIEVVSNEVTVRRYVSAYKACLDYVKNKTPLPSEVTEI